MVPTPHGVVRARILGDALSVLWGADAGPQRGSEIIAAHRQLFEEIARSKREAGLVPGTIVNITDLDVEDQLDAIL
jgi:hypothetical protein